MRMSEKELEKFIKERDERGRLIKRQTRFVFIRLSRLMTKVGDRAVITKEDFMAAARSFGVKEEDLL